MAEWGIVTPGSLNTTVPPSWVRAMGGTFDGGASVLTSISAYMEGTDDIRAAVYQGGSLSTGPDAATLVWDAGLMNSPGTAAWVTANHPGGPYPALTNNEVTWVAIKAGSGSPSVYYSTSSGDSNDFQSANGRYQSNTITTDETVAWPSTWPTDGGSFGATWFSINLGYESSGPNTSIIVPTGPARP